MNKYYCTKCDKESVVRSSEPELEGFKCCEEGKTTLQRLVSLRDKPTPKKVVVEAPKEVTPEPVPVTPKPVTKLDVPTGAVKPVLKA